MTDEESENNVQYLLNQLNLINEEFDIYNPETNDIPDDNSGYNQNLTQGISDLFPNSSNGQGGNNFLSTNIPTNTNTIEGPNSKNPNPEIKNINCNSDVNSNNNGVSINSENQIIQTISLVKVKESKLLQEKKEEEESMDPTFLEILQLCKEIEFMKNVRVREYGKYKEQKIENHAHKYKNRFILENPKLIKYFSYFNSDATPFIQKRIISIKQRIFIYGVILTNQCIIDKSKQLLYLDYKRLMVPISIKFNIPLFDIKLETLFADYQRDKESEDRNHNRDVISYIKNYAELEDKAFFLINFTFRDLLHLFICDEKNGLKYYLKVVKKKEIQEIKKETGRLYLDKSEKNRVRIFKKIVRMLCFKLEEYFQTNKGQSKIKKNKDNSNQAY